MTSAEMEEAIEGIAELVKPLDWAKRVYVLDQMASLLDEDGFLDANPVLKADIVACRQRMVDRSLKEAA